MAKATMTAEHKEALAQGRAQARAVREYLDALESHKPKRGRKRTADSVKKRLDALTEEIEGTSSIKRVQLVQERLDLERELEAMTSGQAIDLDALRAGFLANAKAYSQAKGISYAAWREVGVPAEDLREAGISRS
ncbi:MAG: hypothetical protein AAGA37_13795 [Actinomycetota bacterium]